MKQIKINTMGRMCCGMTCCIKQSHKEGDLRLNTVTL